MRAFPVIRPLQTRAAACALIAAGALAGCGTLVPVSGYLGTPVPTCSTPGPTTEIDTFHDATPLTSGSNGLQYGDIRVGCGAQAKSGSTVSIEYTGWLSNGQEFDTSRDPDRQPLEFIIGTGQVIPGVDQGVIGMRVGGKRRLVVPPPLAFGAQGSPPVIPANATLYFDVELVAIS